MGAAGEVFERRTFANCDFTNGNGCETDLSSDVNHCGTCAFACSFPHAAAACTGGACIMGVCDVGFAHCAGNTGTGCETDLVTDKNNCGACGAVCPNQQNCHGGVCS